MEDNVLIQPLYEWKKEELLTNYYTFPVILWGKPTIFSVSLEKSLDKLEIQEKHLLVKIVNKEINWVENNKDKIVATLIAGGMLDLAEDWASSGQEVDGKEECYEMEDGQQVQLPIDPQDFSDSLFFNSLGIDFEEEMSTFSLSLYINCSPDYFAYHSIEVFIESNHEIRVNGLAG